MLFVAVASLVTGVGHTGPGGFAQLPLQFLLKRQAGATAASVALFFAITAIPWYLKPVASMVADALPIGGRRRRPYLLFGGFAALLAWTLVLVLPRSYVALLLVIAALELAIVVTSAVFGGILVESGRAGNTVGPLTSLRLGIIFVAGIAAAPLGGWLATQPLATTVAIGVALQGSLLLAAATTINEPPIARRQPLGRVLNEAARALSSRPMLLAAALGFLALLAPGFGTPLLYHQADALGHSEQFIGWTRMGATAAAGLVAAGYALASRRLPLRSLLNLGVVAHAGAALLFLALGPADWTAGVIIALYGGGTALLLLPLWHLAARVAPPGFESLAYAVMMSVLNLAQSGSDVLGSMLVDRWALGFDGLIWVNSASTLAILALVPLVPRAFMGVDDRGREPS